MIVVTMGAAYEAAKAGGKHSGLLKRYRELPSHLLLKATRSFTRRIAEHEAWIARPETKLGAGADRVKMQYLTGKKWPQDLERLREQFDVLRGILQEERKR
jgi:hypothetical protein